MYKILLIMLSCFIPGCASTEYVFRLGYEYKSCELGMKIKDNEIEYSIDISGGK